MNILYTIIDLINSYFKLIQPTLVIVLHPFAYSRLTFFCTVRALLSIFPEIFLQPLSNLYAQSKHGSRKQGKTKQR